MNVNGQHWLTTMILGAYKRHFCRQVFGYHMMLLTLKLIKPNILLAEQIWSPTAGHESRQFSNAWNLHHIFVSAPPSNNCHLLLQTSFHLYGWIFSLDLSHEFYGSQYPPLWYHMVAVISWSLYILKKFYFGFRNR